MDEYELARQAIKTLSVSRKYKVHSKAKNISPVNHMFGLQRNARVSEDTIIRSMWKKDMTKMRKELQRERQEQLEREKERERRKEQQ